jgi:hypothetical protein
MPKEPITLSPQEAWGFIELGFHPSDAERIFNEGLNTWEGLEACFPRALSDGAAKLLTQTDLARFFSAEDSENNVIETAIDFHYLAFLQADPETRGSRYAHNNALSEQAVRRAIEFRDRCRRHKGTGNGNEE